MISDLSYSCLRNACFLISDDARDARKSNKYDQFIYSMRPGVVVVRAKEVHRLVAAVMSKQCAKVAAILLENE